MERVALSVSASTTTPARACVSCQSKLKTLHRKALISLVSPRERLRLACAETSGPAAIAAIDLSANSRLSPKILHRVELRLNY